MAAELRLPLIPGPHSSQHGSWQGFSLGGMGGSWHLGKQRTLKLSQKTEDWKNYTSQKAGEIYVN